MSERVHVTCISLRHRTDRRALMTAEVRPRFPQMRFFDAVDGAHPHTIPREILSKTRIMPLAKETARHRKAAGWASHAAVLQNAIRRNAFPHIVLEDDITVATSTPRSSIPYARLPRDAITMLAGRITSVKFKDMNVFNKRGMPRRISNALTPGVNRIDKQTYRLTSAAAYYVPSADVARRFLDEALARNSLSFFDVELYDSSIVTHLLFPSPFQSDLATACASDIMPSQSTFFAADYTPMETACPRRRHSDGEGTGARRRSGSRATERRPRTQHHRTQHRRTQHRHRQQRRSSKR